MRMLAIRCDIVDADVDNFCNFLTIIWILFHFFFSLYFLNEVGKSCQPTLSSPKQRHRGPCRIWTRAATPLPDLGTVTTAYGQWPLPIIIKIANLAKRNKKKSEKRGERKKGKRIQKKLSKNCKNYPYYHLPCRIGWPMSIWEISDQNWPKELR